MVKINPPIRFWSVIQFDLKNVWTDLKHNRLTSGKLFSNDQPAVAIGSAQLALRDASNGRGSTDWGVGSGGLDEKGVHTSRWRRVDEGKWGMRGLIECGRGQALKIKNRPSHQEIVASKLIALWALTVYPVFEDEKSNWLDEKWVKRIIAFKKTTGQIYSL